MNVWFSITNPQNQNNPNHSSCCWVGTRATLMIMSIFVVVRQLSRCNGFRTAEQHANFRTIAPKGISKSRKAPSWLEACQNGYGAATHRDYSGRCCALAPLRLQHNRCYFGGTKALFSTTDDETKDKETAIVDDNGDATSRLLYQQFKDLSLEIRKHDELYYGVASGDGVESEDNGEGGRSVLSDDEFDALVRREEELEENHPDLLLQWQEESGLGKAATRSGRVGTLASTDRESTPSSPGVASNAPRLKRKHLSPMLSLDNVYNVEQLKDWLKKVVKATEEFGEENETEEPSSPRVATIVTEPKLDGVSLSLRYRVPWKISDPSSPIPLELQWASTRGDGSVGQDVTVAAQHITGVPTTIHLRSDTIAKMYPGMVLEVRGEVVLPRSEFLKMKQAEADALLRQKEDEEQDDDDSANGISSEDESEEASKKAGPAIVSFSNPRNAASGLLLRKESDDPEEQATSNELRSLLRFYAYDLSGLKEQAEEADAAKPGELDGIQLREQLSDWGFSLAMPVAITNIEWNPYDDTRRIDTKGGDESSEPSLSWDGWFHKTIARDQIQSIMDYFSALETHREHLREEDNDNLSVSATSKSSSNNNDWGDFDVDGCVHKVAQASIRSTMGYTNKSPKWATAHKFPAQSAVARLLDVIVQVGRTGALTPVAVLEPTEVGGVTVQRATLHNFGHLQEVLGAGSDDEVELDSDVAAVACARIPKYEPVLVQRAGDVIPQVVRRIHKSNTNSSSPWISLDPPTRCPACASTVSYESSSSSSSSVGQVVRCTGPPLLCPPRAVTSLKHAFSRDALDLTGLSEARIQQLMEADLLKVPSDIFTMGDSQWETLHDLPGWGARSCQNLKDSSEAVASRGITLGRFIYSLGIRHLGKHTSELVASCYGSVEAFLDALESASFPQLENKLGIGPVAIDSLVSFSDTKELKDAARALAESLTVLEQEVSQDEDSPTSKDSSVAPWMGFRVVFTGSLGGLTRSKAQEVAKKLGAKATPGSVSKSTDLVVFGDKGGKKLAQARELGIATLEAQDFVKLAIKHGYLDDTED